MSRSPPGDLPDPGIRPTSLVSPKLAGGFFTTSATWEAPEPTTLPLKTARLLCPSRYPASVISPSTLYHLFTSFLLSWKAKTSPCPPGTQQALSGQLWYPPRESALLSLTSISAWPPGQEDTCFTQRCIQPLRLLHGAHSKMLHQWDLLPEHTCDLMALLISWSQMVPAASPPNPSSSSLTFTSPAHEHKVPFSLLAPAHLRPGIPAPAQGSPQLGPIPPAS